MTCLKSKVDNLKSEYDFIRYIELLDDLKKNYLILLAARDTPWGPPFDKEKTCSLKRLDLKYDLFGMYRRAYVAVIDEGRNIFEKLSSTGKEIISYKEIIDEISICINSSGYNADVVHSFTAGSIKINGEECSIRGRGLNFVVYDKKNKEIMDIVNFDTYSEEIACRHPMWELERIRCFQQMHPDITVLGVKSPIFPQNNLTQNEQFILNYNIDRGAIIANLDKPIFSINQYYNEKVLQEVFCVPKSYHDFKGIRRFEDVHLEAVNTRGGHRVTHHQPEYAERTVYLVGGCSVFGIGAADEHTMASFLQQMLNETGKSCRVQNYGYFLCEADRQQEEEIAILESLPIVSGDIVIYYCTDGLLLEACGIPIIDCTYLASEPRDFEIFFDKSHLTPDGYCSVAEKIYKGIIERNLLDYSQKAELCYTQQDYGFDVAQTKDLNEYKKFLTNFYEEALSPKIGSIVMNCNPFTLGHRYLIDRALEQCDFLIVFLVEEDSSFFSFEDRLQLVAEGTKDLNNVAIIPSGRFILSSLTFEEYFNKAEMQDRIIDTTLDITVFAQEIAPCLHITKRFAGEEPFDAVTKQYNETMRLILPEYGIEFIEIPRIRIGDEIVSASRVRESLKNKDFLTIKSMVPTTTFCYLQKRYSGNYTLQSN